MPSDYERFRDASPENTQALREAEAELAVTEEIERLKARVEDLEAERDDWNREAYNAHARINQQSTVIRDMSAERDRLREALIGIRAYGIGGELQSLVALCDMAITPTETTAAQSPQDSPHG